jgi:hypothetical protein
MEIAGRGPGRQEQGSLVIQDEMPAGAARRKAGTCAMAARAKPAPFRTSLRSIREPALHNLVNMEVLLLLTD